MEKGWVLDNRMGGMDAYHLKVIAIVCMALNHYYHIFQGHIPFAQEIVGELVGGVTFPIMAYMLTEGYHYTRNVYKYMGRLGVFALLTQFPYQLFLVRQMNIMFTLLLGLIGIHILERLKSKVVKSVLILLILILALYCDWGQAGVIMILLYHVMRGKRGGLRLPILVAQFCMTLICLPYLEYGRVDEFLMKTLFIWGGGSLAHLLLRRYNGKQGRKAKYLFYVFYPAHLIVLGVVHMLLYGS